MRRACTTSPVPYCTVYIAPITRDRYASVDYVPHGYMHTYNIYTYNMHVMYWRNVDGLMCASLRFRRLRFSSTRARWLPLKNRRSRLRLGAPHVRRMLRFVNEELSNQRDNRRASLSDARGTVSSSRLLGGAFNCSKIIPL